jgi:hypothetical protein
MVDFFKTEENKCCEWIIIDLTLIAEEKKIKEF